jgi:ATP-dependent Lon protease
MKESAQIALSHVRANAARFGITAESLGQRFHLHVPAGAVPKDGPSAGITMATAHRQPAHRAAGPPGGGHDR